MSTMCHFCSMELAKTDSERPCQMYCEVICAKCMKKKASVVDDGSNPVLLCKYCLQDYWNGPFEQDGCSSYSTPLTSPAMSMTSYESCLSSLGDLLADLDFEREDEEETSEIAQVDPFQGFGRHLEDQVDGNSLEGIDIQNYNDGDKLDSILPTLPTEANNRFSSKMVEDLEDNKGEKLNLCSDTKLNLCSDTSGVGSATEKPISFSEGEIKPYPPLNIDSDTQIWAPPEPENQEEDAVGSVADDDDYKECYDGRKWGQSCYSSSPDDELGGSYSFKEQWQKAMVEVMNGRFRVLVRKLLTLERIPFSEAAGDSESWLDVVTSVSWKAAMLIKPGITDKGSATDPGSFVKVKCIASGKRKESQVIRGLVFSKKPGHKHMQTTYKNPRLLLFHGGLGGPEGGLSSLNSIEQEKKHLKSTIELVEMCCPNVVLVEKAVSRDVQESLQAKGITLVFDMKLPRLERIARCTGSHIVSSAEGLLNAKLKQCDTFRIEKVVEEYHFSYNEGARRLAKTLMFFEGCPIPLCCTILLKGAHCDELKKVKFVVQHAVSLAYYLILETSFLVDQRAIFLSTHTDGNGNDILSYDIASNTNISSLKGSSSFLGISSKQSNTIVGNQFQMPPNDDGKTLFDPQCILVLLTSMHIKRRTACKQNQLSRIMFYGSSDMSLGQFLHGILLNQKHQCSTCGEPPEAHNFSYIHQKGKLSVVVKRLSPELLLSGEAKGKLWMWRLCLKCERENGIPKPTRRVTMSSLAHCLSFGKFLDLSISNSTASSRLASCGHLLHRDCLQFYGLGSMVAMVGFSTVDIYTACMPSPILEFNNPNGREWLQNEAKEVLRKGNLLFEEVTSSLQKIVTTFSCSLANQLANELNETEKMLRQEKSDFEKAISKNGNWGQTAHHILNLNRLNHELLLELYVWDRRLQLLQLPSLVSNANYSAVHKEKLYMRRDDINGQTIHERSMVEHGNTIAEDHSHLLTGKDEASLSPGDHQAQNLSNGEPSMNITVAETSMLNPQVSQSLLKDTVVESRPAGSGICDSTGAKMSRSVRSSIDQDSTDTGGRELIYSSQAQDPSTRSDDLATFLPSNGTACQKDHTPTSDHIAAEISIQNEAITGSDLKNEETVNRSEAGERFILSPFKELRPGITLSQILLHYNLEDYGSWVWAPFPETCKAYRMDLQNGCLRKFDFVNSYNPSYLYSVGQLFAPESSRLHFPINGDEKIVSVYEDEFSSIIACALALLQERYCSVENKSKDKGKVQRDFDKSNENPNESLTSLDQEELLHSGCYIDPDQLPALSLEGFFSVDSLLLSKALHPEISLGIGNLPGHSKYSVICIYANQFYALRKRCCPSELDYISSLSRSKKWDAQGGKSGVLFAKTLDDRFIVKQVKKTELNSFLMYAPEYFKHIFHSLSSGSQTCLAKILGIYQVIIRQSKSGKEVRTNLMVMENIFFGRNITKLYDLKGVIHSRYAPDTGGTLLDQNFVEDMSSSPLFVGGKTKQRMQRAIWNDTSFLTSINVMDYSLLLGVDKQSREIVFGIIDYLRQYTWDKQLETWVKSSLVVPKNEMPTVISPKDYKKRFRKFMYTYFFAIPDNECFHQFQGLHRTAGKDGDSQFYNAKVVEEPNFVSNSSESNSNTIITPSLSSDLIFMI